MTIKALSGFLPSGKFSLSLFKIVLPIVIGQLLLISTSFVDNFMVANIASSDKLIAAIGIASQITLIANSIVFGMGGILVGYLAQYQAVHDKESFRSMMKVNFTFSIVLVTAFIILIEAITPQLVAIFTREANDSGVSELAISYTRISAPSLFIFGITYTYMTGIMALHRTWLVTLASVCSLVTNAVCDYLFLYPLVLGIEGLAYATIISRVAEIIFIFITALRLREMLLFSWNIFKQDQKLVRLVLRKWMFFASNTLLSLAMVAIVATLMSSFENLKAGISLGQVLVNILGAIFPAIIVAMKVTVGAKLGKNEFEEARKVAIAVTIFVTGFTAITAAVGILLGLLLPRALLNNPLEQDAAEKLTIIAASTLFFITVPLALLSAMEVGGKFRTTLILNGPFQLGCVFPLVFILALATNAEFYLIFLASQLMQVIALTVVLYVFLRFKWLNNLVGEQKSVNELSKIFTYNLDWLQWKDNQNKK